MRKTECRIILETPYPAHLHTGLSLSSQYDVILTALVIIPYLELPCGAGKNLCT